VSTDLARILIVDESPFYPWFVQTILEGYGYTVLVVQNVERAIELITNEEPDLVILEITLKEWDGFEVCQKIRELSTVPIIICTALLDRDDMIKGLAAGADDYVTKPFYADELAARVGAVLRRIKFSQDRNPWPAFSS
jgi:DNA-binding response OmpR family regulator